jgi:hypothetical protein
VNALSRSELAFTPRHLGAGANVLVGGSGRTFALQPVSLEGSVAVDVALGVSALNERGAVMLKFISAVMAAAAFAGVLALLWATNTRIDATARDAAPQSSPVPQTAPTLAATAMSPELVRLEVARDLAAMRNSVEQLANKVAELAAKQDQMSQNIVTSHAVEQDITQERSSPPLSGPVSPAPRKKARSVASRKLAEPSSAPPPTFAPQ